MFDLFSLRTVSVSVRWLVYPAGVCLIAAAVIASPGDLPGDGAEIPSDEVMAAVSADLGRRQSVVTARLAYKESHIAELVAGRAGLADVAAAFARLNADEPASLDVIRHHYEGRTDEERAARNVLDFVATRPMPAADKAAVLARLRAAFDRQYPPTCGGL